MKNKPVSPGLILKTLPFLLAIEALICLKVLAEIPAEGGGGILFGFSLQRLALLGTLLAIGIACLLTGTATLRSDSRVNRWLMWLYDNQRLYSTVLVTLAVLFFSGWVAVFIPGYRLGKLAAYFERLRPLFIWMTLFSGQTWLALLRWRNGVTVKFVNEPAHKRLLLQSIVVLALMLGILGFMLLTQVGTIPDAFGWNNPGVPLLPMQVYAVLLLIILLMYLSGSRLSSGGSKPAGGRLVEFVLPLLIWLLAAGLWIVTPQQKSFFAPGPYLPDEVFYPFSDAALYDLPAQNAINGLGYFPIVRRIDKPLYSAMLLLFHTLAGDDYSRAINIQTAFLALLPVLVYLAGRKIHSPLAGLSAALFVIFKEANAISSTIWISTTTVKMAMSEVPTALFTALLTLVLIAWIKSEKPAWHYPVLAGGVIGLATLVRHNTWIFVPLIALVAVYKTPRNLKRAFSIFLLSLAAVAVSIAPWGWRIYHAEGDMFNFIRPIQRAIWQNRYVKDFNAAPSPTLPEPSQTPAITSDNVPPVDSGNSWLKAPTFISAHFFHNLSAVSLMLPRTFLFHNIQHTVAGDSSIWRPEWDGHLSNGGIVLLIGSLALLALGIGSAWHSAGVAGMVPLAVFLFYIVSASVARTSGGRYIVPVDWALFLYYALGLVQACKWLFALGGRPKESQQLHHQTEQLANRQGLTANKHWLYLGIIFIIALLVPLAEHLYPYQLAQLTEPELKKAVLASDMAGSIGYSKAELNAFLEDENAYLRHGRLLYPRFYYEGKGEPVDIPTYSPKDYRQLVFTVSSLVGNPNFVLPVADTPSPIPYRSEVIVAGCKNGGVLGIIFLDTQQSTITRSPRPDLTCPLTEPVCDNNGNCY